MRVIASLSLLMGLALAMFASAQEQPQAPAARPAPRWPDGRVSFTGTTFLPFSM